MHLRALFGFVNTDFPRSALKFARHPQERSQDRSQERRAFSEYLPRISGGYPPRRIIGSGSLAIRVELRGAEGTAGRWDNGLATNCDTTVISRAIYVINNCRRIHARSVLDKKCNICNIDSEFLTARV
eukprot:GHVU01050215.1.p2 GENE.GHVU01050215.1~~GHVU01050215.1.p2  ORF type:complete len:128 (-),score=0.25 GHVU01050215.1:767-1150(-)